MRLRFRLLRNPRLRSTSTWYALFPSKRELISQTGTLLSEEHKYGNAFFLPTARPAKLGSLNRWPCSHGACRGGANLNFSSIDQSSGSGRKAGSKWESDVSFLRRYGRTVSHRFRRSDASQTEAVWPK